MRTVPFLVLAITVVAIVGCTGGAPTAGTFSAESKPMQLAPGQKQEVELTIHYRLPSNPPAGTTVSYKVQVTAPEGWSVDPGNWEHSQTMKATDIGFNETLKLSVTVPAGTGDGEHVVRLAITPKSEPAQSVDLKFQVVSKGK